MTVVLGLLAILDMFSLVMTKQLTFDFLQKSKRGNYLVELSNLKKFWLLNVDFLQQI